MERQTWEDKLKLAQEVTSRATRLELAQDYADAFESYVHAADLYIWLVKNRELQVEVRELRERLRKVLARAEAIKLSGKNIKIPERRVLSDEEQTRVVEASSIFDNIQLPLWEEEPIDDARSAQQPRLFRDPNPQPTLAPVQLQQRVQYRRRNFWLTSPHGKTPLWTSSPLYDSDRPLRGQNIVQDVVADCSFVAALEVACEHDARWGTRLAHSPLYPKDEWGYPQWTENGRHEVKLLLNGVARRIVIDESIPCSPDGRPVCAVGLGKDGSCQIWPALLEKAYLRVRGGYNFKGSNSSIDLHALTGWIPEHIGFHHASFQREKFWERLFCAWKQGLVMATAGTARNTASRRAPGQALLVDSHNYAILDITEEDDERWLTLLNPWRKGASTEDDILHVPVTLPNTTRQRPSSPQALASGRELIRMTWGEACARLDSLYLNWNPSVARHTLSIHSCWREARNSAAAHEPAHTRKSLTTLPSGISNMTIVKDESNQHSKFRLTTEPEGSDSKVRGKTDVDVWLHLVRHATRSGENEHEWIAIHVFESEIAKHRLLAHGSDFRVGTYVDSAHSVVRFSTSATRRASFTVVVSKSGSSTDTTFSLSAFSAARIEFSDLPRIFSCSQILRSSWQGKSCGGNASSWAFIHNPQFRLTINKTTSLAAIVETSRDLSVQVLIVWSRHGERVSWLSEGDVVASSGSHNFGIALAEAKKLSIGAYVLIVSTFEKGQAGQFTLQVQSEEKVALEAIEPEGAGMFKKALRDRWARDQNAMGGPSYGHYFSNPSFRLDIDRACRLLIRLRSEVERGTTVPHVNITLFRLKASEHPSSFAHPQGFSSISSTCSSLSSSSSSSSVLPVASSDLRNEIATSGAYVDHAGGVTMDVATIEPGAYLLIASTFAPGTECPFVIDLYSSLSIICRKTIIQDGGRS